ERVETSAAIGAEPAAHRLGRDMAPQRTGDGEVLLGLLREQRVQAAVVRLEVDEVGDDAVAKERDLATTLVDVERRGVVGIGLHRWISFASPGNPSVRRGETVIEVASDDWPRFVWATPCLAPSPARPCSEPERSGQRAEVSRSDLAQPNE